MNACSNVTTGLSLIADSVRSETCSSKGVMELIKQTFVVCLIRESIDKSCLDVFFEDELLLS